jgi:general secretion pathway protein J
MAAHQPSRNGGFTLIELLVAIGIMALMASLTWRGLDGISRAQNDLQMRSDKVMTVQAGLSQWTADLDAVQAQPGLQSVNWDGRALRLTRRSSTDQGSLLTVVAWARRDMGGTGYWIRWQSAPVVTRSQWETVWAQAAQWGQNPGDAEKQREVILFPLQEWQVFYFRADAWTNPLSSDNQTAATPPPPPPSQGPSPGPAQGHTPGVGAVAGGNTATVDASATSVPEGIRIVLTLPAGHALNGKLTKDWIRPTTGGGKS